VGVNHPFIPPPTFKFKTYPIAILLHEPLRHISPPPPTPPFYAIHHTILISATSCKGQGPTRNSGSAGVWLVIAVVPLCHCWLPVAAGPCLLSVGLHKIFVHFKAILHYSIILVSPPPSALFTLLQYDCTTIAPYTHSPPTPPFYAIHHTILISATSCKGHGPTRNSGSAGVWLRWSHCWVRAAAGPCPFVGWPSQDIRSLQNNLARFNNPCIAPSICIARTIAILITTIAQYATPPDPLLCATHHIQYW